MSTLKKAKVIMLLTNEPSKIGNLATYQKRSLSKVIKEGVNPKDSTVQFWNLYIISDEEMKKGDYVYVACSEVNVYEIRQITEYYNGQFLFDDKSQIDMDYCKKIIATTDTSLLIDTYINQGDTVKGDLIIKRGSDYTTGLKGRINLPQPSKQFIQKFVEEYNKGNVITDVLVEYEEIIYNPEKEREYQSNDRIYIEDCDKQTRLKINYNDNTITIKKIKDIWSREEVIEFGEKIREYCKETYKEDSLHRVYYEWDEFIKENL